jgi:predicted ester cyclase
MSEENKAAFRRVTDAFSSGDFSAFDDLIAPDMVEHNPAPGQAPGPEGMKQMAGMFRTAFPDARITVEDLIAEGDKVVGICGCPSLAPTRGNSWALQPPASR